MLSRFFHNWERRLADVSKDRVVRPFEWGLDWIEGNGHAVSERELERAQAYVASALSDTQAWFTADPCDAYEVTRDKDGTSVVTFPSALVTPHPKNNVVQTRYFPARIRSSSSPRRAVLYFPSGIPMGRATSACAGCSRASAWAR